MYTFAQESLIDTYAEMEWLYREHYAEMAERKESLGLSVSPYNPRLDLYFASAERGDLLTFVARHDGKPVGYINVYITNDMHNHDKIASEDVLFVTKAHRNGLGKKLVQFGLEELRNRGVKHLNVAALTDLRVEKLWRRMGFKPVATQMIYVF
jgi:ribosomal protein S18 acetylase RimI-like enzyme